MVTEIDKFLIDKHNFLVYINNVSQKSHNIFAKIYYEMELLTTLLLAHLLADFPLQTNSMAAWKSKSSAMLLLHVVIHVIVLWSLLGLKVELLPLVLTLGAAHWLVDWSKPRLLAMDAVRAFILDQFVHVLCLLVAARIGYTSYHFRSYAVISTPLLYTSLLISFGLGVMVYYWLWTSTLNDETIQRHWYLRWCHEELLMFEQWAGYGLVCMIFFGAFFK